MAQVRLDEARGRWVLLAAVLGSGMALLDATVVNVALPTLGKDLGAGFAGLQWTVNGYTLSLAALILLGGALGDRYGRRRVFVIGTVWFAAASVLCAVAPSVGLLVAARVLQGIGGALLTPGSLALIAASFQEQDRGRAIGAWSGLGGVAGALGPFLGGLLVEVSWRLVFLINIPLAAVVVLVAVRHVPESRDEDADPRLDLTGAALAASGLALTTYALVALGRGLGPVVAVTGAAGLLALLAFVLVERRSSHPMLPVALLADRQSAAANAVTATVYAGLGGVFFLLVVHLQVVGGFTPLAAGTALLPITACMLLLSSRSGALAARIGPRRPLIAGPLVCAGGVLLLRQVRPGASYLADVLPGCLVFGLGLSLVVAPLTATVLAAAATRYVGVASGVNNAVARTAGLLAVAVLPVLAGLTGDDYRRPAAFAAGFRTAMIAVVVLLVLGSATAAALVRDLVVDPDDATGAPASPPRRHCAVEGPPVEPTPARRTT
jgi:EmrB/QacA subfamily drug resistance transporter